jgi:hypothetical protein
VMCPPVFGQGPIYHLWTAFSQRCGRGVYQPLDRLEGPPDPFTPDGVGDERGVARSVSRSYPRKVDPLAPTPNNWSTQKRLFCPKLPSCCTTSTPNGEPESYYLPCSFVPDFYDYVNVTEQSVKNEGFAP